MTAVHMMRLGWEFLLCEHRRVVVSGNTRAITPQTQAALSHAHDLLENVVDMNCRPAAFHTKPTLEMSVGASSSADVMVPETSTIYPNLLDSKGTITILTSVCDKRSEFFDASQHPYVSSRVTSFRATASSQVEVTTPDILVDTPLITSVPAFLTCCCTPEHEHVCAAQLCICRHVSKLTADAPGP